MALVWRGASALLARARTRQPPGTQRRWVESVGAGPPPPVAAAAPRAAARAVAAAPRAWPWPARVGRVVRAALGWAVAGGLLYVAAAPDAVGGGARAAGVVGDLWHALGPLPLAVHALAGLAAVPMARAALLRGEGAGLLLDALDATGDADASVAAALGHLLEGEERRGVAVRLLPRLTAAHWRRLLPHAGDALDGALLDAAGAPGVAAAVAAGALGGAAAAAALCAAPGATAAQQLFFVAVCGAALPSAPPADADAAVAGVVAASVAAPPTVAAAAAQLCGTWLRERGGGGAALGFPSVVDALLTWAAPPPRGAAPADRAWVPDASPERRLRAAALRVLAAAAAAHDDVWDRVVTGGLLRGCLEGLDRLSPDEQRAALALLSAACEGAHAAAGGRLNRLRGASSPFSLRDVLAPVLAGLAEADHRASTAYDTFVDDLAALATKAATPAEIRRGACVCARGACVSCVRTVVVSFDRVCIGGGVRDRPRPLLARLVVARGVREPVRGHSHRGGGLLAAPCRGRTRAAFHCARVARAHAACARSCRGGQASTGERD